MIKTNTGNELLTRLRRGVVGIVNGRHRLLVAGVRRALLRETRLRLLGVALLRIRLLVRRLHGRGRGLVAVLRLLLLGAGAGIFKLAHALAHAPEQLRNTLGAEQQDDNEKNEQHFGGAKAANQKQGMMHEQKGADARLG